MLRPSPENHWSWADAPPLLIGALTTLAIHGYRFGDGNHTIYLLDALRQTDSSILRNDWFLTQTLQYHALFGWIAGKLLAWKIIQPVFLVTWALLIATMHIAWLGITRQLGGTRAAYLASVALYYLSAAGTGLGMYQFLQDSSVLPSNIANVALLWAIYLLCAGRLVGAGACVGVAGVFHLNHAIFGIGFWILLSVTERAESRRLLIGSLLAIVPSAINIGLALQAKLQRSGSLPLDQFIDLYVRLRHPHHYDPSSWPVGIWMAFLWPIPVTLIAMRSANALPAMRLRRVFLILLATQVLALSLAGVFYVSQTLVQMSLYRFSIFVQLIACVGAAVWCEGKLHPRMLSAPAAAICSAIIAICLLRGPFYGAFVMPTDDPEYLELCDWARDNTDRDAIFVVPPDESAFRLHAQRAIVVNFKAVPQLSGELPAWRDRLRDVLALDGLSALPHGYLPALSAIRARYDALTANELISAARRYGAAYIVSARSLEGLRPAHATRDGRYFVYDVSQWKEIEDGGP